MRKKVLVVASLAITLGIANLHRKKKRRFKVRPLNQRRAEIGHFACLVNDMKTIEPDFEQYFKYTRMMPTMFQELLCIMKPSLQKKLSKNPISPAQRLLITLHYLAEGCSMQELAWNYRLGKSSIHYIIKETVSALWDNLQPLVLPEVTKEQFVQIEHGFNHRWNMPNCIGAVDGKHVSIQAPKHSGSDYFSYKKSFSLILLAACDADYCFTMVDIGAAGSNHDSTIFKDSTFGTALINGQLDIPPPKFLPGSNVEMNHFVVADQAFPLNNFTLGRT